MKINQIKGIGGAVLISLGLGACGGGMSLPSFGGLGGGGATSSVASQQTEEAAPRQNAVEAAREEARRAARNSNRLYADWAALVVAGDYRAATGAPTEAFDNARRDVATQLAHIGFQHENIAHLSVRPQLYGDPSIRRASLGNMRNGLTAKRDFADAGCLVYLTSHGGPQGIVLDDRFLSPAQVDDLLDTRCGNDPTILIVSACYSGVFAAEEMLQPNRFIMTAARSDRTSFGCGEGERYPYFDRCIIETFPQAADWLDLARSTRACVAAREQAAGLAPPSAPQIFLGPDIREFVLHPFPESATGPPALGM